MKTSKLWVIGYGRDCDGAYNECISRYTHEALALEIAQSRTESGDGEGYQAVDEKTAREYCDTIHKNWPLYEIDMEGDTHDIVRGTDLTRKNIPYTQWIVILVALICEDANITPDQIALTEGDLEDMYERGLSPSCVYFNQWQGDGGNFFAI